MWRTVGHEKAKRILQRGLVEDRVSHAYMLSGPAGVGKMTLALDLARALNCLGTDKPCDECVQCGRIERGVHADLHVIGVSEDARSGRQRVLIGIEQIREALREASLKPYEGSYRVFIIDGAENLSEEAANSLLKTLEEPPEQVVLVLLTTDHNTVLPTLVSRCQLLELRTLTDSAIASLLEAEHGMEADRAGEIAKLSQGVAGWAVRAAAEPEMVEELMTRLDAVEGVLDAALEQRFAYANELAFSFGRDRDRVRRELDLWRSWWRDVLLVKHERPQLVANTAKLESLERVAENLTAKQVTAAVEAVADTKRYLDRNVNPRLALEDLMLALPRSVPVQQ